MSGHNDFEQLVGMTAKMAGVLRSVENCAEDSRGTLLITGEPGTGKKTIARSIHSCGENSRAPFTQVNCAAMDAVELDRKLFCDQGSRVVRGSLLEKCHSTGGTLFVDGVYHLPAFLQQKFCRELNVRLFQQKRDDVSSPVPLRIIVSTSRSLQHLAERQLFNSDLYAILSKITIVLPPLRERRECLPALVDHYISYFNFLFGKKIIGARYETMTLLQHYGWPGNVRELRDSIAEAVRNEISPVLTPSSLPPIIQQTRQITDWKNLVLPQAEDGSSELPWVMLPPNGITLEKVEKKLIEQALQRFSGNQSKAARCLGMSRDTIRYRIKKFGLN